MQSLMVVLTLGETEYMKKVKSSISKTAFVILGSCFFQSSPPFFLFSPSTFISSSPSFLSGLLSIVVYEKN
jgi:hypothetical protein